MLLLSIIVREFKQAARRKRMHWLRIALGCGIGTWFALVALRNLQMGTEAPGHAAYNAIVWPLAFVIAILAPALAASSIARERSEGTLGLLFHTHLRPLHIVLAKFSARLIELLLIVLVVLPFMALPIWLGGISYEEVAADFCILLSLGLIATAAALFASAVFRNEHIAFVAALVTVSLVDPIVLAVTDFSLILGLGGLLSGYDSQLFSGASWLASMAAANPSLIRESILNLGIAVVASVALLVLAMWILARISAGRSKHDKISQSRRPVNWLGRWNWIAGLVFVTLLLITHAHRYPQWLGRFVDAHYDALIWLAKLTLLVMAARSIAREKEERTLESLITTPLSNATIANRTIYNSCASCLGWYLLLHGQMLLICWSHDEWALVESEFFRQFIEIAVCLLAIPVIGCFCSAFCRTTIGAMCLSLVLLVGFGCIPYLRDIDEFWPWMKDVAWWKYRFRPAVRFNLVAFALVGLFLYGLLITNFRRFAARQ